MKHSFMMFILILMINAIGENIYVAQTTAGSDNGSSCANAKAITWLNNAANWGAGTNKVSAGDTVSLCGTISTAITMQGSGSAGSPILIRFESGAKLSAAYWTATGAINISSKSYITIDGGTNGIIECTDNGSIATHGNSEAAVGVYCYVSNGVIVRNLTISNIYIRNSADDTSTNADNSKGVSITSNSSGSYRDISVIHNTISNAKVAVGTIARKSAVNLLIDSNTIDSCNWGISIGTSAAGDTADSIIISNNDISNFVNWDDLSASNYFHHDGIFCYSDVATSKITNIKIYGNKLYGSWGSRATAGVYCTSYSDPLIYNNLFLGLSDAPSNGMIYIRQSTGMVSVVANNTIIGGGSGIGITVNGHDGTQTDSIYNNIIDNFAYDISITYNANVTLRADNNFGHDNAYSYSATGSAAQKTFAEWQALGFDVNGSQAGPLLDGTYNPTASSTTIGAGKNLSNYFTTDRVNYTRPASWGVGAYEYQTATKKEFRITIK